MQAPGTEAPRRIMPQRAPVAVTVAPVMSSPVGPQSAYLPNASGPPDARTPIMPQPMPAAIAAGQGGAPTTQAPNQVAQTAAPVAYAMKQYQEHGDPFTAIAQGLVNAQAYRQDAAQTQAKQEEAAKLLEGHPDLQEQVKNGVLDLSSAIALAQSRDQAVATTDRKAKIIDYLSQSGDHDIAEQYQSGILDEDGVAKAIAAREGTGPTTEDQKNLAQINSERKAAGQPEMPMEEFLAKKKDGFGSTVAAGDLPIVSLGQDGIPDKDTQQSFLDALPDQHTRDLVKGVASYQIDLNTVSIKDGQRARIATLAKEFDPTYTTSQYKAAATMRQSITSGPYSQTLNSANLVIQHLASLKDAFDELHNQSGLLTLLNGPINSWKGATGDKNIKKVFTARDGVATELGKVFRASGAMSEGEIEEWKKNFDTNTSPEGMQGSIEQAMTMLQARLDTIKSAYNNAMGKPQDFTFLTSQSVEALSKLNLDPTLLDPLVQDGNAQDLTSGFTNLDGRKGKRFTPGGDQGAGQGDQGAPPAAQPPPAQQQAPQQDAAPVTIDPGDPKAQDDYAAMPDGTHYTVPGDPTVYVKGLRQ